MLDFDGLRETLLRAGIAPRHVRRYLKELRHHRDDLIAEEHAHGVTGPAADQAASLRLGSHDELAGALLAKPELRSMTARQPWLAFGVLPPLAVILGVFLLVVAVQLAGIKAGAYIPRHGFRLTGVMFAANFLIVPLSGALLAWTAQRQRMKPIWPLLSMALILMLSVHGSFHIDAQGRIFRELDSILPITWAFGRGATIDWPTFLAQAALLCLPLAWLLRARHKAAAVR